MNSRFLGRLFWKILFAFSQVILTISQLLWLGFTLNDQLPAPCEKTMQGMINLQLTSAVSVLQHGGLAGLKGMKADWPATSRRFFSVIRLAKTSPSQQPWPGKNMTARKCPVDVIEKVTPADGHQYQLRYDVKGLRDESMMGDPYYDILNIPEPMMILPA